MEHIWEHSTRRCSHLALRWKHEIWDASWEFSQRQQVDKDPVLNILNRIFQGIVSKPPDFLRVEFGFQTSQVEGEAWNNHWLVVWNMNGLWLSIILGMECHHPNWRIHSIIFQRGRYTNYQIKLSGFDLHPMLKPQLLRVVQWWLMEALMVNRHTCGIFWGVPKSWILPTIGKLWTTSFNEVYWIFLRNAQNTLNWAIGISLRIIDPATRSLAIYEITFGIPSWAPSGFWKLG